MHDCAESSYRNGKAVDFGYADGDKQRPRMPDRAGWSEIYSFLILFHDNFLICDLCCFAAVAFAAGQKNGMEIRARKPVHALFFGLLEKSGDRLQEARQVQRF